MNDPLATLDQFAAKAGKLYSLPAVAMKVLELTRDLEIDNHALKACIEHDPALTAKLLKVVNSSLFGLSRKVSDLSQALALLGTKPLKLLVLGFSLPMNLCDGVQSEMLRRYWRHSLTKAVACRKISETVYGRPGDEAFLAGLLQDLGILLLLQEVGEPYARFLEQVFAEHRELAALESKSMGFDHTSLTARLLDHWNLPPLVVEAVACGSGSDSSEPSDPAARLAHVLRTAELFTRFLADGQQAALAQLVDEASLAPGLNRGQVEAMLDETLQQVEQLAETLALELPDGVRYEELAAQAHEQLAAVAADAAEALLGRQERPDTLDSIGESLAEECRSLSHAVHEAAASRPSPRPAAAHAVSGRREAVPTPSAGRTERSGRAEPDPGLIGRVGAAVTACRQNRLALSLLLVELDRPDSLILARGMNGFQKLLGLLRDAAGETEHPGAVCLAHGEAGFALLLSDCERQQAVHLAGQLADGFRRNARQSSLPGGTPPGLGLGVATVSVPSRNFRSPALVDAADRCLYASRASGGVVKSIEIY